MRALPYLLPILLFAALGGVYLLLGYLGEASARFMPTILGIVLHLTAGFFLWYDNRSQAWLRPLLILIALRLLLVETPLLSWFASPLQTFAALASVDALLLLTYLARNLQREDRHWSNWLKWILAGSFLALQNHIRWLQFRHRELWEQHTNGEGFSPKLEPIADLISIDRAAGTICLLALVAVLIVFRLRRGTWLQAGEEFAKIDEIGQNGDSSTG